MKLRLLEVQVFEVPRCSRSGSCPARQDLVCLMRAGWCVPMNTIPTLLSATWRWQVQCSSVRALTSFQHMTPSMKVEMEVQTKSSAAARRGFNSQLQMISLRGRSRYGFGSNQQFLVSVGSRSGRGLTQGVSQHHRGHLRFFSQQSEDDEESHQRFRAAVKSQKSLDSLSQLCIQEGSKFDAGSTCSAILLATVLISTSEQYDSSILEVAVMPHFTAENISSSFLGLAMLSSKCNFPMDNVLTEAIAKRLWVPESAGGVDILPVHASQMILGLGRLKVDERDAELVATVCMRTVETLKDFEASDCANVLVGLSIMEFPEETLLSVLPEKAVSFAPEMQAAQLSEVLLALATLSAQAKRSTPGHPGFLIGKRLEELGHTAAVKLNDMMGVSCADTLVALGRLGYVPSGEAWVYYVSRIERLMTNCTTIAGRQVVDVMWAIAEMGSGDLGNQELERILNAMAKRMERKGMSLSSSERQVAMVVLEDLMQAAEHDPGAFAAWNRLSIAIKAAP